MASESSVEPSSTTITSSGRWSWVKTLARVSARKAAPLKTGMTTLMSGESMRYSLQPVEQFTDPEGNLFEVAPQHQSIAGPRARQPRQLTKRHLAIARQQEHGVGRASLQSSGCGYGCDMRVGRV